MTYSVDNKYIWGEKQEGKYVLLEDNHEIAHGFDAPKLQLIANILNLTPEITVTRAREMLSKDAA